MKKVLVTGGAGYVGAALIPRLLADGLTVRVLDLCLYGKDVLPRDPHLELVEGDIRDPEVVKKCV
ncbi:NAD-dependent epimerase/dehydratase family protein, partial [Aquimarina sp. 433]